MTVYQRFSKSTIFATTPTSKCVVYLIKFQKWIIPLREISPNCLPEDILYEGQDSTNHTGYYVQQHVCANFVYDLNGRKGPNKVGKDIGYITALYPVDPEVVMVLPIIYLDGYHKQIDANRKCKEINSEYSIPNREEALSIYFNNKLNFDANYFWTSTSIDSSHAWVITGYSGQILIYPKMRLGRFYVLDTKWHVEWMG